MSNKKATYIRQPLPPPRQPRHMGGVVKLFIILLLLAAVSVGAAVWKSTASEQANDMPGYALTLTQQAPKTPIPTATAHLSATPTASPTLTPTVPDYNATQQALEKTAVAVAAMQATTTERAYQNVLIKTQIGLVATLTAAQEHAKDQAHENNLRRQAETNHAELQAQQAQQAANRKAEEDTLFLEALADQNAAKASETAADIQRTATLKTGLVVLSFAALTIVCVLFILGVVLLLRAAIDRMKEDNFQKEIATTQASRAQVQNTQLTQLLKERALVTDLVTACIEAGFAGDHIVPRFDKIKISSEKRQRAVTVLEKYGRATVERGVGTALNNGTIGDLSEDLRTGKFPTPRPSTSHLSGVPAAHHNTPLATDHPETPIKTYAEKFYQAEDGSLRRLPGT